MWGKSERFHESELGTNDSIVDEVDNLQTSLLFIPDRFRPFRSIIVNLGAIERAQRLSAQSQSGMMMIVAAHARFQFEQSVTRPEKKYLKSVERTDGAERKQRGREMLMVR